MTVAVPMEAAAVTDALFAELELVTTGLCAVAVPQA